MVWKLILSWDIIYSNSIFSSPGYGITKKSRSYSRIGESLFLLLLISWFLSKFIFLIIMGDPNEDLFSYNLTYVDILNPGVLACKF